MKFPGVELQAVPEIRKRLGKPARARGCGERSCPRHGAGAQRTRRGAARCRGPADVARRRASVPSLGRVPQQGARLHARDQGADGQDAPLPAVPEASGQVAHGGGSRCRRAARTPRKSRRGPLRRRVMPPSGRSGLRGRIDALPAGLIPRGALLTRGESARLSLARSTRSVAERFVEDVPQCKKCRGASSFFTPYARPSRVAISMRGTSRALCLPNKGASHGNHPHHRRPGSSVGRRRFLLARQTLIARVRRCADDASCSHGGTTMKWMGTFFLGYILLLAGIFAALWKLGVLANVSGVWIAIGAVIAVGVGLMVAVANSGRKETIQIDK